MSQNLVPDGCIQLSSAYADIRRRDRGDFLVLKEDGSQEINPRYFKGCPEDCDPISWAVFQCAEESGEGPLIRAIKNGDLPVFGAGGLKYCADMLHAASIDWHATLVTGRVISIGLHDDDRMRLYVNKSEFEVWFARLVAVDLLALLRDAVQVNGGPISQREAERIARAAGAKEPREKIRRVLEGVQGKQKSGRRPMGG